ncbi:ATP-binding protein [Amycolatopsis sp. cmx-8-4]|uniref:ATP-binding protein n=1 Tax=Amycolatopsis sp. cmx-8-4 TaxID=2790947 RepID=UPI00397DE6EA
MTEQTDVHNEVNGTVIGHVFQGRDVTVAVPAALPVAVSGLSAQPVFVGREGELAQLADALKPIAADTFGGPVVVSAIAGLAGVGKTTLAVRAAHDAITAGWFPGGALMVDLRGYDPPERRVQPTAALASLLGAIGTPSEHIPPDQADRGRLWRSLLANHGANGRRMLILLDNTSSAEQVRPLLPGPGGHGVLLTSRHSLADLDGARLFDIDVLSAKHAVKLLHQELTIARGKDNRIQSEPAAAFQLARLCDGLPLAIRIAAALLAADADQPIAELIQSLTIEQHRLKELDYEGNLNVRAAFDLSYQHLAREPARLFRLLGLHTGSEISTEAAAALVDAGIVETRRLIGQLRRAHLAQPGTCRGRWRMHDLLRLYAIERAEKDEECEPALDRLLHYYVVTSKAASSHFDVGTKIGDDRRFTGRQHALAWFSTEYTNLVAAFTLSFDTERYGQIVALADALHSFFAQHGPLHARDWITIHKTALTAARKIEDREAEARIHGSLGLAFMRSKLGSESAQHHQQALEIYRTLNNRSGEAKAMRGLGYVTSGKEAARWLRQALAYYQDSGDRSGEAVTLHGFGELFSQPECADRTEESGAYFSQALEIYLELGDRNGVALEMACLGYYYTKHSQWAEALQYHHQARDMWRDLGNHSGEAFQMNRIGYTYREMGRLKESVECCQQALALNRQLRDNHGEADTLHNLGQTYHKLEQLDHAINCYQRSIQLHRELGHVEDEANALADLGYAYRDAGILDTATAHWMEALNLFTELDGALTRANQLRAELAATNFTT